MILTLLLLTVSLLTASMPAIARDYNVYGPQGGISMTLTLPDGFDVSKDKCPVVILMHGIFASKDINPMPALARSLASEGIASIRFDFNGHGKSQGRMEDMTIEKEIADAMAVWNYARNLPYVTDIGLLGHSQGGAVASMTAGRLAAAGEAAPAAVVLIAPGSVIKEACQGGKFFNARFDPKDPPAFIRCWGVMKLGREYLLSTQELDIYGTAANYEGPVLLLHGSRDSIVPLWCSERYRETYGDRSELKVVEGENHLITRRRKEVVGHAVSFFRQRFEESGRN